MKRNEKAAQQREMKPEADGYCNREHQAPGRRQAAKAERGHARYTPSEFREHWMGRRSQSEETARAKHDEKTRYPRRTTRRG